MQLAPHPYVTTGVAIVGASLIAVTPVAAPLPDLQSPALTLTAGEGFFDTWADVFNTASANATQVANNFLLAPGVGLQQLIVNQEALWGRSLTARRRSTRPSPRSRTTCRCWGLPSRWTSTPPPMSARPFLIR